MNAMRRQSRRGAISAIAALLVALLILALFERESVPDAGSPVRRIRDAGPPSSGPVPARSVAGAEAVPMQAEGVTPLTRGPRHDDFPVAAVAPDGTVWCAYVSYRTGNPVDQKETDAGRFEALRTRGHGDQVRLIALSRQTWSTPLEVSKDGLDVWRPGVAVDGDGAVWIVWSQQVEGNWDLYGRSFDPEARTFNPIRRLTNDAGADINAVAAAGKRGVWIVWQAKRGGDFDIRAGRIQAGRLVDEQRISTSDANDWSPAVAAAASGDLWIAWDTYHKGDYDVYARKLSADGPGEPVPIATSSRFEARPSVAVDRRGRVWIAFEEGGDHWGKDYGPRLTGQGVPFYLERHILVRCLEEGRLRQTASAPRSRLVFTHYDDTRYKGEFRHRISMPRLGLDSRGNVWLLYRRHPLPENVRGERWVSFARYLNGGEWSEEVQLPRSDNLLDNRPALASLKDRGLVAVYSTDGRTSGSRSAKVNNLNAVRLSVPDDGSVRGAQPKPPVLVDARPEGERPSVPLLDPDEAEAVERCREYRVEAGGRTYRLLRGEFHRHTEMSAHRDWDGPMEEVWRYGLDVAGMDWIGPGDHDYAVSQEYMWWLTQKQIDLFHDPPRFLPMFTYERSVPWPSGHRNVMFAERGVRPLPQMRGKENRFGTEEGIPDIRNLYAYLKFFDGICSSHTSATNMGTDWRGVDTTVEPVVEVFQGHRQNYEEPHALLAARNPQDTIQGYRPQGFVWEAFKKGVRLGFQSSSDHVSTHTSYAFVLAEEPTRRGVLEAFKRRNCYAANDNIILDVRCGGRIMGDEFALKTAPTLEISVVGTSPIARIDVVRQIEGEAPKYVYLATPGKPQARLTWTDKAPIPGKMHMYYVRIQQEDARMAWASPMWIEYRP